MVIECSGVFADGGECFAFARDEAEAVERGWQQVDGAWVCPWCNGTREVSNGQG